METFHLIKVGASSSSSCLEVEKENIGESTKIGV
jgi:hypothetical protein